MTDRATADRDPFRVWLEASRAFLAADPLAEPLRGQCESLFATWSRFAGTYAEAARTGGEAGEPGATGGPFDPLAWMDAASTGGFGDLWRWFGSGQGAWQAEREALQGSREWAAYVLALGRYQAVMAEAWLAAFRRFTESLGGGDESGKRADGRKSGARRGRAGRPGLESGSAAPPPSWETIRARWQEAADFELARAMRSDAFLAAQRDLMRARLDCAALIRGRLETLAELLGLPTRGETDELGERLHRLEREMRALRARAERAG